MVSRLPALKGALETEEYVSPRGTVHPIQRIDYLEEQLAKQEKTTAHIIDKAFKIKEDLIKNLDFTHGTWQEEKRSRELLQDHIRTITDVVRRMSADIVNLQENLRIKEAQAHGATQAVKTLEVHQAAGISELRGRVGRSDLSMSKLSTDLRECYDNIKETNHIGQELHSRTVDRIHNVDSRVNEVTSQVERVATEWTVAIQRLDRDLSIQLEKVDSRMRTLIEEVRVTVNNNHQLAQSEAEKLEARFRASLHQELAARDVKQEKFERKMEQSMSSLSVRFTAMEEEMARDRKHNASALQALEKHLETSVETRIRQLRDDFAKLKIESRDGFSTVHDSLKQMKQVLDGRLALLEEQLRKEIQNIRKMVVLI